jgi:hypothetical protein
MPSNVVHFVASAAALNPVVDQATIVLTDFLHCDQSEALSLLRKQSHWAHVDLIRVATAVVEADFPDGRWGWKPTRRADLPKREISTASAA